MRAADLPPGLPNDIYVIVGSTTIMVGRMWNSASEQVIGWPVCYRVGVKECDDTIDVLEQQHRAYVERARSVHKVCGEHIPAKEGGRVEGTTYCSRTIPCPMHPTGKSYSFSELADFQKTMLDARYRFGNGNVRYRAWRIPESPEDLAFPSRLAYE